MRAPAIPGATAQPALLTVLRWESVRFKSKRSGQALPREGQISAIGSLRPLPRHSAIWWTDEGGIPLSSVGADNISGMTRPGFF